MQIVYKKGLRNAYAKEVSGEVKLIIPYALKNDENFLEKMQLLWMKLQQKLNNKIKNQIFSSEWVLLFGERVPFGEQIHFDSEKERDLFFQQELFDYASPILQDFSEKLWFHQVPLTIRKVRSKRGSCTYDNRIMLNLSLVHLPTKLIQYVIVHEVCHLKEKNHSSAFWELVAKYCPHFKALRKELKNQIFVSRS